MSRSRSTRSPSSIADELFVPALALGVRGRWAPALVLAVTLVCSSAAHAQADTSAITASTPRADRTDAAEVRLSKSPWLAVGLSAAVPGLGQFYNHDYWKVPVIWGIGGYWVYEWIRQNDRYAEFRDAYEASLASPTGSNDTYKNLRDFYRDDRDRFAWFLGGLYVLNLLDAYVGAHLYDFDVTPELGADGRLSPKMTATLRVRF